MLPRIDAIQGFERRLAGVDRVRQRIAEIENKFGINNTNIGEDFQSILNKELEKVQNVKSTQKVNKTEKTEKVANVQQSTETGSSKDIETFETAEAAEKSIKNNSSKTNGSANRSSSSRTFPGEEALPDAMKDAINPFAAVGSRSSVAQSERIDEEEIETPTRETKRLSFNSNATTEDLIEAAAEKYDIDSKLVKAVAIAESNMNQDDISDAGAIGVMQLMPETAAGLGIDPYDEQQNIEGGTKYLKQMLDTFGGNVRKAVAAYNAGPGAVQKYGGIPPYSETQHYVGRVMDLYR